MTEDTTMGVLNHLYGTLEPLFQPEARTRFLGSFFRRPGRDPLWIETLEILHGENGLRLLQLYAIA